VTRQGITIDLERFAEEGISLLPMTGLFLQTYNPAGLRRRSSAWSPDIQPYAKKYG
jgi:hypothetical protein